ncbi:MAG: Methyltransferase type 11, partial [Spirosoma sp.]|nr:Methyltransferase type 11 [Spirosoma sp.]
MQPDYYMHSDNLDVHVWDINALDAIDSKSFFKTYRFSHYINKNDAILDIGCGPGVMVKVFRDNGYSVLGVDLNRTAIERASKAGLPVELIDAVEAVRKYKSSYSVFHMSDFVEHVPLSVFIDILEEISTVKDALMYVATPNLDSLMGFKFWFHMPSHITPLHPFVLYKILAQKGFSIVDSWSEYGALP